MCPLRWQLLPVMAPGRTGQDTCLQVAVEGGHGPEGMSWVSDPQALHSLSLFEKDLSHHICQTHFLPFKPQLRHLYLLEGAWSWVLELSSTLGSI